MNLTIARCASVALALVLSGPGWASADNLTPATARSIAINSTAQNTLSNTRTTVWYKIQLYANRSYQFSAWSVQEDGDLLNISALSIFSDAAGTVAAAGQTPVETSLEGSPNENDGVANPAPHTTLFQPTTSGVFRISISTDSAGPHSINFLARETTLFSPWFFVSPAGGYDGFHEVRNNTAQELSVTLRAFSDTGAQIGIHTFTLPANATVAKSSKTDLGVASGFGGTVLTHNGAFGAISANTTTLSGLTGLSFDSPFTPRDANLIGAPIR